MKNLLNYTLTKSQGAEIYKKEQDNTSLRLSQGKVQKINGKKTSEIALRLINEGNMGSAVSTSLEDQSIVDRALISCQYQKSKAGKFSNQSPAEVQCFDDVVKEMTIDEMAAQGQEILDTFKKYDKSIVPDVYINRDITNTHIANSEGFDHNYNSTNYSLGVITKTPKGFMEVFQGFQKSQFFKYSDEDIQRIIHLHQISQNRVGIKTGKIPVIFSGRAMGSLMFRLLSGVKAGNVLKHLSPLEGKLGEKIFSDAITIRDDGTMPWGFGSCAFDDEGVTSQNTVLVENGVLKNYLVGLGESEKIGMAPTGNSFKRTMFSQDIEDAPATDSTNLIIEGKNTPDQQLISNIKYGLYIDSVMGAHTGNIPAGEFSLNVGCGYLIEDGKFTGKVMDSMVAGNIYEDFKKIIALGSNIETMSGIFYSIGYSPAVLFSELSVVGKG